MSVVSDAARSRGDVMHEIAELKRQVAELTSGRRLEAATIGAGGITIQAGGKVLVCDDVGNAMIWLGQVPFGEEGTKPGLVAFRAGGGPPAMSLFDGIFAAWDRAGNIVMSTDEASGQGIARPWLPVTWAGSDYTKWPGTTSGAFAVVVETAIPRQQPRIFVRVRHSTDVSGTTGELRLMCDGTQLGTTVPVAYAIDFSDFGPVDLPPSSAFGDTIGLSIDARRTAGTGAVRAMVTASWTQQSP